jgi:hypothetical protein
MLDWNKIPALYRVPVRFGFICGSICMVLVISLFYLGKHPLLFPVFLDFRLILFPALFYFMLKEFRDFYHGGVLHFWQGLILTIVCTLVWGLFCFVVLLAFSSLVPEFISTYIHQFQEAALKFPPKEIIDKIGKEAFERNLAALSATKGIDVALLYWKQGLLISAFFSIIIAVILRTQPKT